MTTSQHCRLQVVKLARQLLLEYRTRLCRAGYGPFAGGSTPSSGLVAVRACTTPQRLLLVALPRASAIGSFRHPLSTWAFWPKEELGQVAYTTDLCLSNKGYALSTPVATSSRSHRSVCTLFATPHQTSVYSVPVAGADGGAYCVHLTESQMHYARAGAGVAATVRQHVALRVWRIRHRHAESQRTRPPPPPALHAPRRVCPCAPAWSSHT
jgi:hypothetical protein